MVGQTSLFNKDQAKKWVGTCPPCPTSSDAPEGPYAAKAMMPFFPNAFKEIALQATYSSVQMKNIEFVLYPVELLFLMSIVQSNRTTQPYIPTQI